MSSEAPKLPASTLRHIEQAPENRALIVLLRHAARDRLPPDGVGYDLPITAAGRRLARDLGVTLRGRLRTLHTSPLARCVQTAEALAEGARAEVAIISNRLLGDPGAFVFDGELAWTNWQQLGHEGVMHHLVTEAEALPGMARPDEAARYLVRSMLTVADNVPGIHVFVTHDALVTATAARMLRRTLGVECWPEFLEGALFWTTEQGVHTAYRDLSAVHCGRLCSLTQNDVIEFTRRELGATIGLDLSACFSLVGDAFTSLLTGRPPYGLDLWVSSEHDRALLINALRARSATHTRSSAHTDAFKLADRVITVHHGTKPDAFPKQSPRGGLGLKTVCVEYRPSGSWSAIIRPPTP